jgi:hypothetical protein
MSVDQYRSKIKSSVWQAIAESGVNLSSLTAEQQAKLVDTVSDHVLIAVNDLMDDLPQAKNPVIEDLIAEEIVLWEGRPFLSLVEFYTLTNERIKIARGLIGKDFDNYELIRIQDIDVTQTVGERILNLGDIHIKGADLSHPDVILRNLNKPQEVYEILRKAWLSARKRYGLLFREEM